MWNEQQAPWAFDHGLFFFKINNFINNKFIFQVSGFCCPCHGWVHWTTIEPGKNNDGYWTNAHLVQQLGKAMKKAEEMHPQCEFLWLFDNSANHHAKQPGGLDVKKLNLNDGGKNYPKGAKPGWFMRNGEKVIQTMYHPAPDPEDEDEEEEGELSSDEDASIFGEEELVEESEPSREGEGKGLRTLLKERGLWRNGMKKEDAAKLLSEQPDFEEQGSWLEETIKKGGEHHHIDFYPKYHCELAFIEKVWALTKRYCRDNCDYSFEGLRKNVPEALKSVPKEYFAVCFRSCSRYILAYKDETTLTPAQVKEKHKKYKGHRRINETREINELIEIVWG